MHSYHILKGSMPIWHRTTYTVVFIPHKILKTLRLRLKFLTNMLLSMLKQYG